ncbi:MAG: type III-B CRISPR module-associated protein Cmr3 [Pyrinomonadaceae bacterium]
MSTWIIEPHDSFIARDGRPFGLLAGVRATSLPFPFPSTTTGGVRTRDGLNAHGVFESDAANINRVKELEVRGPLLIEVDKNGSVADWYVPAPADALVLNAADHHKNRANVSRLIPKASPPGAATNLPSKELLPLYLDSKDKNKPHGYAPRFWRWEKFNEWLRQPRDFTVDDLFAFGIRSLPQDERSHVAIEADTQASEEGYLFQTRGLEFTRAKKENNLEAASRLALALNTDAAKVIKGVASLGGERRLVSWREFTGAEDILVSQCAEEIAKKIIDSQACRLVLLTPCFFEAGWKPSWLLQQGNLALKAAAIGRAQVISGWDFERGTPKPTRRLVPAGSVFFFRLNGTESEIRSWITATWMSCISDDDSKFGMTPRKDGFGLAVLGTWNEGKDVK